MRVGVNAYFLVPKSVGGVEVYLRNLLPEIQRADPSVELVLFTTRSNHATFDGFERVPGHFSGWNLPWRIWAEQKPLVNAVQKAGCEILFSPCFTGPINPPFPHVVTIHDVNYLDVPESFLWPIRRMIAFDLPRVAGSADAITTVSEFSRNRILEVFGIEGNRVIVTPNAPGEDIYHLQPCPLSTPFLLFVGFTYPHKNVKRLSRAFLRLVDSIPHDLVIVGKNRGGEPLRHPRIRRLSRVSFQDLIGLYHGCDLFVYPSRYEGFGMPALEALAAGARVVASTGGAIPEVCGKAATYFDPYDEEAMADAIIRALDEAPEERRARVEAGIRHARTFTWRQCAERTLDAFRLAAERFPTRGAAGPRGRTSDPWDGQRTG